MVKTLCNAICSSLDTQFVPHALHGRVDQELDGLEMERFIEAIQLSDWANPGDATGEGRWGISGLVVTIK